MKPTPFDRRIIDILSAYRCMAREKQANLAGLLKITQPEYSRIEKGQRALSAGNVHTICTHLKLEVIDILTLAEITLHLDFDSSPFHLIVSETIEALRTRQLKAGIGRSECQYVLARIRSRQGPRPAEFIPQLAS
jgi:hypothetical protein